MIMTEEFTREELAKTFMHYTTYSTLIFLADYPELIDDFIKVIDKPDYESTEEFKAMVNFISALSFHSYNENMTKVNFEGAVKKSVAAIDNVLKTLQKTTEY